MLADVKPCQFISRIGAKPIRLLNDAECNIERDSSIDSYSKHSQQLYTELTELTGVKKPVQTGRSIRCGQ